MTSAVLLFGVAGILIGGAIAFWQQKKPPWVVGLLLAAAAASAWFAFVNVQAVT